MDADSESLKQQLAARFKKLQEESGLSAVQIQLITTHNRKNFGWIRNARRLPPLHVIAAADKLFNSGTELVDLAERILAVQETQRLRELTSKAGAGIPREGPEAAGNAGEEATPTDRRELLQGGSISMLAALAADRSREIAGADLDPTTMIEVEEDIDRVAAVYTSVPHTVLLPDIVRRWRQVDAALGRRSSLSTRNRLTTAAGRLTYYLSRLSFNTGDFGAALRFAALAGQYAAQVDDRVVLASVAGMNSGVAFYRQQYADAVTAFTAPDPAYLRARNAAYRARAYAAQGDAPSALAELDTMRSAPLGSAPQPGDLPLSDGGAAMFTAVVLVRTGDGQGAEQYARDSIAVHEQLGPAAHVEEFGHALFLLATALLQRNRPEPEEAAALGRRALDLTRDRPTHTVTVRADVLARDLRPYARVPEVTRFREQLQAAPRPMLTSGR